MVNHCVEHVQSNWPPNEFYKAKSNTQGRGSVLFPFLLIQHQADHWVFLRTAALVQKIPIILHILKSPKLCHCTALINHFWYSWYYNISIWILSLMLGLTSIKKRFIWEILFEQKWANVWSCNEFLNFHYSF